MLKIEGLTAGYSPSVPVLHDVSLSVGAGQFISVVGPNGAGKTTLFKAISGIIPLKSGRVSFDGQDISNLEASRRPHLGIAHVPEGRQVFPSMTVLENLELGAATEAGKRDWAANLERIYTWFPVLAERSAQYAGTLSGGQQQMLAIGRGLASSPKLIMLDEPSMGLAPSIADFVFEKLIEIRRELGLAILLVEQRVAEALQFADRGYVLETGSIVMEGDGETLKADDRVRQAYLGI
ncbi:MAG: branched-chain amino acid ABC transporter ATP-binding protein [Rhizobium sp.]|nr:MAG: branched-chain amino acid ABC transporter ATP-binding protein [Rhizobium sp.]